MIARPGASCAGRSTLVWVEWPPPSALRASRSPASPPGHVSTSRPKPAGNRLTLRAGGIGQNEGGGRVVYGATRRWLLAAMKNGVRMAAKPHFLKSALWSEAQEQGARRSAAARHQAALVHLWSADRTTGGGEAEPGLHPRAPPMAENRDLQRIAAGLRSRQHLGGRGEPGGLQGLGGGLVEGALGAEGEEARERGAPPRTGRWRWRTLGGGMSRDEVRADSRQARACTA
jgi:hypothetical protein